MYYQCPQENIKNSPVLKSDHVLLGPGPDCIGPLDQMINASNILFKLQPVLLSSVPKAAAGLGLAVPATKKKNQNSGRAPAGRLGRASQARSARLNPQVLREPTQK
jgi:hypothetical protein